MHMRIYPQRMDTTLTPIQWIREQVFRMKQPEFAREIGCAQSSVSRWENGGSITNDSQKKIREAAQRLRLPWNDSWFYAVPEGNPAANQAAVAA